MSIEKKIVTINRNRPIRGNKNNPTWTVPAEHSHAKHAAEDNWNVKIENWFVQINK